MFGRREESQTLSLPSIYGCAIKRAKFDEKSSEKICECECSNDLHLIVKYDFDDKTAKLYFNHGDEIDFEIQSLNVTYNFTNSIVNVDCIEDSKIYQITTKNIKRHVFYHQFSAALVLDLKTCSTKLKFNFDIPFFQNVTQIKFKKIDQRAISEEIENLFLHGFEENEKLSLSERNLLQKISVKQLERDEIMRHALDIENLTSQQELLPFMMKNIKLNFIGSNDRFFLYRFRVEDKLLPPNAQENSLKLFSMTNDKEKDESKKEKGSKAFIKKIIKEKNGYSTIEIDQFQNKNTNNLDVKESYEVRFIPNDVTHQACQKAITSIGEKNLEEFFKNFESIPSSCDSEDEKVFDTSDFVWFNKNIATNQEQKLAINKIVNCTAFPFPYCIFGPPGTGKTSCVVECVLQILKLKPTSKVLITAQSNSACNEIGDRLLNFLEIQKVFRLYSSRLRGSNPGAVSSKLQVSSNLRGKYDSTFPTMEELKFFPVVICTLSTSSQLDRASLYNHFDYIFIDECAATNEPESCIPIVELGCDENKIHAKIVLIGDHKQLPPVISSIYARDHLDLGVSLMERVMTTRRYQPTPSYDSNFIVQLLDNYRSHPSILHFSNVEFYDSKLRAKCKDEKVEIGTKWNKLPNDKFPILFHCDINASAKLDKSSFNRDQINIVQKYVDDFLTKGFKDFKIKPEDIGIVTPYKAQSDMLKRVLPDDVEVGTSEYYQGREKLIMIISTVKSKSGIGFVSDERRLNVCLTRAKALMIVVGNSETLKQSELWRRFIEYCKENNSIVGPKVENKNGRKSSENRKKKNDKIGNQLDKNFKQNVDQKFIPKNARKTRENRGKIGNELHENFKPNLDQKFPNTRWRNPKNNFVKKINPGIGIQSEVNEQKVLDPKLLNQRRSFPPRERLDKKNETGGGRVFKNSFTNQKFQNWNVIKPTSVTNNSAKNGNENKNHQVPGTSKQNQNKKVFEGRKPEDFSHFNNTDPFIDLLLKFNNLFKKI